MMTLALRFSCASGGRSLKIPAKKGGLSPSPRLTPVVIRLTFSQRLSDVGSIAGVDEIH